MSIETPEPKYLKDYLPPGYLVDSIDLVFDLHEEYSLVKSTLSCRKNPESDVENPPFLCYGEELELEAILLNGKRVKKENLELTKEELIVKTVPDSFQLEVKTRIYPHKNTALEGLYKSGGMFCTQCEAEGFRRITYFPDRPDVMSRYTVEIIADKSKYPVLLSNGNMVESGNLVGGRHWVRWEDPFKKPSYLFALVAGDLSAVEDTFTTRSGRGVDLTIYVEKGNEDKCGHAMQSLKQAMKWDEDVYGREYDLDRFMIVAVNDFNAGAMENKGLNIFNSSLILARPETATDMDYERIQGVVAHEYFHNWTGNRITCRDWFQLSLKEGLTIYRDQEFSADLNSRTVKRISDVNFLRTSQFAEDAGPMAHQVRPDSYIEVNNFYTVTIYHKGAEIIRMIALILGEERFFRGMDLYFERHDGKAVTIEDFVQSMEHANLFDLSRFRRWYSQAGTPVVEVTTCYDEAEETYSLTLRQSCSPTPGQKEKEPFHIPIRLGLLGSSGKPITLESPELPELTGATETVLNLTEPKQTFVFKNVKEKPVPSLLRGFSAPVKLQSRLSDSDLLYLMAHDTDSFNRWESAQQLLTSTLLTIIGEVGSGSRQQSQLLQSLPDELSSIVSAYKSIIADTTVETAVIAQTISLPTESYLMEQMEIVDVDAVHAVRQAVKRSIAAALKSILLDLYFSLQKDEKASFDPVSAGKRALKNTCLDFLMSLGDKDCEDLCLNQFKNAANMTNEMRALSCIANELPSRRREALQEFYLKWEHEPLVINIWLTIQAASRLTSLEEIKTLMKQSFFDIKNPNNVRALIGSYCFQNLIQFHDRDGGGYRFLSDIVLQLNKMNPQIAARLVTPLTRWKKFDEQRSELMKRELHRIHSDPRLSKNVYEVVSKSLVGS